MKHPMQPTELDSEGVLRFKGNAVIRYLLCNSGYVNLDDLRSESRFSKDDWAQFNQLIGYSVSGYLDLDHVTKSSRKKARKILKQICPRCHQFDGGQTGEYPCSLCGLPIMWDEV